MKCARANASRQRAVEGQAFEVRAKWRTQVSLGAMERSVVWERGEMAAKDGGVRRGMLDVSERVRKWRAQAIGAAEEGPGWGIQGRVQK